MKCLKQEDPGTSGGIPKAKMLHNLKYLVGSTNKIPQVNALVHPQNDLNEYGQTGHKPRDRVCLACRVLGSIPAPSINCSGLLDVYEL